MAHRTCSVDGCGNVAKARGLCGKHHQRMRRAGQLAPLPTAEERFLAFVDTDGPTMPHMDTPCHVWTAFATDQGYGRFNDSAATGIQLAHRWAWHHFVGPIPDGLYVLHACDNPPCCRPMHLFLGTHLDNMADRQRKDRQARGDNVSMVLNDQSVLDLRTRYSFGEHPQLLAEEYGVTERHLMRILDGKFWTHLPVPDYVAFGRAVRVLVDRHRSEFDRIVWDHETTTNG